MTRLLVLCALLTGCAVPLEPTAFTSPTPVQSAPAPAEPATAPLVDTPRAHLAPIRYWVKPDIDNRDEVVAGVEAWAETTRGVREWVETADDLQAELAITAIGPYGNTCGIGGAPPAAVACVQGTGGLWQNVSGAPMWVFLITTTYDGTGRAQPGYQQNAKLTTMHELGHLLGLRHGDGAIMAPTIEEGHGEVWECPDAESVYTLQQHVGVSGLTACASK